MSTVVTVCDIVKKKDEDNTNSSYYSHNDYDRYSKEKDYSPDLENDDDDMVKKQLLLLLLLLIAATTLLLLLKNKKNNHLFTIKEFFL